MKIIRNGLTLLLALYSVGCASVSRLMGLEQGHILVTYYAPAWGPDTNGSEVVYFLKQVTFESESQQRTRIYFCSIKPDGTDRKEITWLWRDQPDQFFENFSSAVTMDVNAATRRAAIGVQLGGIWIDGDGPRDHLQRDIVPPRPRGDHGPEMPRRRQFRLPVQDLRAEPLRLRQPPRPFVIHRQIECLPNCHR